MTQSKEVRWVQIGEFIDPRRENNRNLQYGVDLIEGVTSQGEFAPTKAVTTGINLKPYKVVRHGDFAYNPSRLNIGSLAYREGEMCIVSHLYVIFYIKPDSKILPQYLMLFFRRKEFLRMVDYHNYGSQRAEFNMHDISEFQIPVPFKDGEPDVERQREVVDVWQGLRRLKEDNEALATPLLELCQAKMNELKHTAPMVELGKYIEQRDERNTDNSYTVKSVRGLATSKEIIPTKANMQDVSLTSYKLMNPFDIAYVADTSRRGDKVSLGYNETDENFLLSSISTVFTSKDFNELDPTFIYLWFCRPEFDRYARFNSWGSARETFSWEEMCRVKVPKPSIEVQRAIVDIYHCARQAKQIAEEASKQLKTICPALMQHIIHS